MALRNAVGYGAVLFLGIWILTLVSCTGPIEADLGERTQQALAEHRMEWAKVSLDGRDVKLHGEAPSAVAAEQAVAVAWAVYGVRHVAEEFEVQAPGEVSDATAEAISVMQQVGESLILDARAVAARQAGLEAAQCQQTLRDILASGTIEFATGSDTITAASFSLLHELAVTAERCPEARLEIAGHTDTTGDQQANIDLSNRRAAAVVKYLVAAGVNSQRLEARGYGSALPIANNDTAEGRAKNRRIEFNIKN